MNHLWADCQIDHDGKDRDLKLKQTLGVSARKHDEKVTKRERLLLPELLATNETPLTYCSGYFDDKLNWLIAVTNRRIILLFCSFFGRTTQLSIELSTIKSLSGQSGMLFGSVTITYSGANSVDLHFSTLKSNVNGIIKAVTQAMHHQSSLPITKEQQSPDTCALP